MRRGDKGNFNKNWLRNFKLHEISIKFEWTFNSNSKPWINDFNKFAKQLLKTRDNKQNESSDENLILEFK